MTTIIRVKNSVSNHDVDVFRIDCKKDALATYLDTLKPGEENEFTCWEGNQILVKEVKEDS